MYVDAPPGVIVTVFPEHIVPLDTAVMATVGVVLTTIVLVAVLPAKQPEALLPVNE